jgi:hypothetical protein
MSGIFLLDWAALAVSIHNTILLLWLALTILLNAERRTLGLIFAGASLLCATAFFASHTVILVLVFAAPPAALDLWWRIGLFSVGALPLGWYLVTVWYAGNVPQIYKFALLALLNLLLAALLIFANPLPTFDHVLYFDFARTPEIFGVPILLVAFALDIFLCVAFSLDALRRPAPMHHAAGDLARTRARPWLIATSATLILVGALVVGVIAWAIFSGVRAALLTFIVAWIDLIIALLIALSIIFVGQAVAFYELFTGKILPRRDLFRQWRGAVILAGGYGSVVAFAIRAHIETIYAILLATALMTIFYALVSWRGYVERERYIRDLRPFVQSGQLYDHLLNASLPELDAAIPFRALVRDGLGARVAHLAPVGALAPLVPSLAFPNGAIFPAPRELAQFNSLETMCVAIEPAHNGGALWAIPLWSERGLIGILRLGEKSDGGLYAQEEIEIARASGERLIDTLASAELARRLMALQRQHVAESQLLDQRARRVLHDEILPKLHAAILEASAANQSGGVIDLLTAAHRETAQLLRELPTTAASQVARLGLITALRQMVEDEWMRAFDRVEWQIENDAERVARDLPSLTAETFFFAAREAIRNAARYGRDASRNRALNLRVAIETRGAFQIAIEDDGIGLHTQRVNSETLQGAGQGLALHSAMLAVIGGALAVTARAEGGTRVTIKVESL